MLVRSGYILVMVPKIGACTRRDGAIGIISGVYCTVIVIV